ncbi:arsenate reductase ArsC [Woodsholea maritima]|uniref:arsenate reductase ArsC n=1 Tax=Woodsholea maritima TaxID=240237 RepID=UPI0003747C19|nr:arsenate reductase ArsC [Woodsholea maritima]
MKNILILCTGNSARSILAETLFNFYAQGRIRAYSAGSRPAGKVHRLALSVLQKKNCDLTNVRSKSWDEFALPDAPQMDIVITVCDSAASEACPIWPGSPVRTHWGLPDPAAIEDPDQGAIAFETTAKALETSIRAFFEAGGAEANHQDTKLILERTKPQL